MKKCFKDEGKYLWHFADTVLVCCLQCGQKATISKVEGKDSCPVCNKTHVYRTLHCSSSGFTMTQEKSPCFIL